uniref:Dmx like 1 n=1 Tax=Rousettus aegyptiacus TaxID=9407 RepID=A0A7J8EZ08_ROUAE|nr:Dmx like 1 [Rousettus aegyptiacus]
MNLHQVLTGAVNPGDHCFSVGSVGDQRFTAYASGCDIVILGSDFERLQIIPGAKHGNIQVGCVDCSMQQGKELYSQWQKSGQFFLESIAHNITWDPAGKNRSRVNGNEITCLGYCFYYFHVFQFCLVRACGNTKVSKTDCALLELLLK